MTPEQRKAVKAYVKSKGITLNAFGVGGADNEEGWRKLFVFAKDMDIPLIVSEPKDEQWDYVNKLAGEFSIPVAIHDHPRPNHYWHPDSVLLALKGHPNIGVCADIGHWVRNGLNVVDCIKKCNGKIMILHLKDVAEFGNVQAPDVLLGEGVCNIPAVLQELKNQNFKGVFSIEYEEHPNNNMH